MGSSVKEGAGIPQLNGMRSIPIPKPLPISEPIPIPESIPESIPETDSGAKMRNRFQKPSEVAGIDSEENLILPITSKNGLSLPLFFVDCQLVNPIWRPDVTS